MNISGVPVITYHSVGIPNNEWIWSHLTCPYSLFENHLLHLKKNNFNTITLQQLYDYMSKKIPLPSNPIVLTFDDGYLDNLVFAYPLLKKYNFNATIYVNPEFIDSRDICRPSLEDVWKGNYTLSNLKNKGYLSWPEISKMHENGIFDVQGVEL